MWISQKSQKSQNLRNYILDEFLLGWVLTLTSEKFGCFRCVLHRFLNALRPLDPNLKYCQFSRFFDFWFLDFDNSTIEISTIFHLWVPKYFFSKSIIIQLFQKQKGSVNSHYFIPYSHFGVFPQFPYIDLWANFHLWVYCRIFYGPRNFSSKSLESQLSNALSNAFIALLVPEISSFQFQKVPQ